MFAPFFGAGSPLHKAMASEGVTEAAGCGKSGSI